MGEGTFLVFSFVIWGLGVLAGWQGRGWIADMEHDYRWDVEGCRHNIEEKWRGPRPEGGVDG